MDTVAMTQGQKRDLLDTGVSVRQYRHSDPRTGLKTKVRGHVSADTETYALCKTFGKPVENHWNIGACIRSVYRTTVSLAPLLMLQCCDAHSNA